MFCVPDSSFLKLHSWMMFDFMSSFWDKYVIGHYTLFTLISLLLFYAITTVFQLYHCSDMIFEMRRRKSTYTFTDSKDL